MDWISINDDLPKESEVYIVTWTTTKFTKRYIGFCEYNAEEDIWYIENMPQSKYYKGIKILAWIECPVPYPY